MKLTTLALLLGTSVLCSTAAAQIYAINWYKIAGGGGTSTNGQFAVSGTIGQPDASNPMTGGGYSLTGGFWSIYAVPQAGVPNLTITRVGPHTVEILWPAPSADSYTLQQTPNLSLPSWTTSGYTVTSANGTNSIAITSPSGNLFFRLSR